MELDELKAAWREVTAQLDTQREINLALLRESRVDKARKTLRPLYWGQQVQIVCGVVLAVMAAPFWLTHLDQTHLMVVGLISHVYALMLIIAGARTFRKLRSIDFGAPVIDIQKQIARLEQIHVQNGWLVGLPWWLVWLPISLLVLGLVGVDVYAAAPKGWILYSVGFGLVGALLTVVIYQWALRSGVPERAARAREMASGKDFSRAREYLSEIQRFEQA